MNGPIRLTSRLAPPMLVIALVSAGCGHLDTAGGDKAGVPQQQGRQIAMNQQWQNRPLSELVAAMGEPRLILTIPGGGNPPGFAIVYGVDPKTGCLDAFALLYGADPSIRSYHCR